MDIPDIDANIDLRSDLSAGTPRNRQVAGLVRNPTGLVADAARVKLEPGWKPRYLRLKILTCMLLAI